MYSKKTYNAFTLVEMLVVMGILVILMTMGIFAGRFAIQRANRIQHQSAADQLYQGFQSYYADNREYPSDTEFSSFGYALGNSDGALSKYVDSNSFDGGSPATFYYASDSTGQSMLVCVSYGGANDSNNLGGYCNGNGFGLLPTGSAKVTQKDMDSDGFDVVTGSGMINQEWNKASGGWQ
jgi:prepilin-type N-terminal cleavage/methylation domain-containing protein